MKLNFGLLLEFKRTLPIWGNTVDCIDVQSIWREMTYRTLGKYKGETVGLETAMKRRGLNKYQIRDLFLHNAGNDT